MIPKVNKVKERLGKGGVSLGATVFIASPEIVEMVGNAGYDFVWIDCEHGSFYLETAVQMIRAAEASNVTPVVRVPDHDPSFIMRILDAGAIGVIIPGITTKEQAQASISAAKYSPQGVRGACPNIRAAGHRAQNWPEFVRWSNENIMVWLLVEGVDGVANFDRIIEVEGIDAVIMGPFDLSQSMGYPGQVTHPEVVEKLEDMIKKARAKSIEVVTVIFNTDLENIKKDARHWVDLGCRILVAGADKGILAAGFNSIPAHLKF